MQPIPRKFLEHTVAHEARTATDRNGAGTYAAAVTVAFVRCEPVSAWKAAQNGEMKDDKLTLFYDCVNSDPAGRTFKKGDRVTYGGAAYTVRDFKDFSPHHLEIFLK